MDSGIAKVTDRYSGFGGFLNAAKKAVFKATEGDISYDAGVEMDLKLTAALMPVSYTHLSDAARSTSLHRHRR